MTTPEVKSLFLVMGAYSSNDDYNGDADLCVVELTAQRIRYLLDRMELVDRIKKQNEPNLFCMKVFDDNQDYVKVEVIEEADHLMDIDGRSAAEKVFVFDGPNLTLLASKPEIQEDQYARMEGRYLQVQEDKVNWMAWLKHCNVRIDSEQVSRATLEGALKWLEEHNEQVP